MTMPMNQLPPNDGKNYVLTESGWVPEYADEEPMKEKWYRISEITKCFGVPLNEVKYAVNKGKLPHKKIPGNSRYGTVVYISESAFKEWLNNRNMKTKEPDLDPNEKWFTIDEAAKELHHERSWIYKLARKGTIKAIKSGRNTYISETALIEYLENKKKEEESAKVETVSKQKNISISGWNDVSVAIQEFIQKQVEAAVNEKLEVAKKAEYQKGFEDGKLSVAHDTDDAYRRGVKDGKKEQSEIDIAILRGAAK